MSFVCLHWLGLIPDADDILLNFPHDYLPLNALKECVEHVKQQPDPHKWLLSYAMEFKRLEYNTDIRKVFNVCIFPGNFVTSEMEKLVGSTPYIPGRHPNLQAIRKGKEVQARAPKPNRKERLRVYDEKWVAYKSQCQKAGKPMEEWSEFDATTVSLSDTFVDLDEEEVESDSKPTLSDLISNLIKPQTVRIINPELYFHNINNVFSQDFRNSTFHIFG